MNDIENPKDAALGEFLSEKVKQARTKLGKEEVLHEIGDAELLRSCCKHNDPKVRKNAYRLIGALESAECASCLKEALKSETTLYAIPSLILALGKLNEVDAVREYVPPVSTGIETDKHIAEITEAKKKALQRSDKPDMTMITSLSEAETFICVAPQGMESILTEELCELGFEPETVQGQVMVKTAEVAALNRASCMCEALIPVAKGIAQTPEEIAAAVKDKLNCPYRIELRGYTKDRAKLIRRVSEAIGGDNNPSNYERELRIVCDLDRADLYIRLWNVVDTRYPWRVNTIPASMSAANAAALVRYAHRFERTEYPSVLDPFCGSGTLLFARAALSPCRGLLGVDKSGSAVSLARKNAEAGRVKASFICKDATKFLPRDGFDLVLANLPFGNRVGTHQSNRDLYRAFLRVLPSLLRPNGIAALYTMEYHLLERCLEREKGLRQVDVMRTEAGGLFPWIFIIDKADND